MGRGKSSDFTQSGYQPAGIYGWRKQCLYAMILFILIIVIMNAALTVWILRVLNFNITGLNMGTIKITKDGISVGGLTKVIKPLHVTSVKARQGNPLSLVSDKDIFIKSRTEQSGGVNHFHISKNKIEALCDTFEVQDTNGQSRFRVSDKGVIYSMDEVTYSGKAIFNGSIETPNIRGPRRGSLRLESASSSIILSGRERVLIEAPEGNVDMKSAHDITFNANRKITLNSTKLFMKNIDISTPTGNGKHYSDVYQLCMCQNGRLFLAPPTGRCVSDQYTCS